jgi:hypothetical protein
MAGLLVDADVDADVVDASPQRARMRNHTVALLSMASLGHNCNP